MKSVWTAVIITLAVLFLLIFASCKDTPATAFVTEVPVISKQSTVATETITSTAPEPTPSLTSRSPTQTGVPTSTSSPTLRPKPTLGPTAVVLAVEQYLKTNGNCQPPCFWGISPEKSTFEEALAFFNHIGGGGLVKENYKGQVYFYTNSFRARNQTLPVDLILNIQSGVVQSMEIFVGGFYEPGVTREDWSAYSLKNILSSYGVPSYVGFAIDSPHEPPYDTGLVGYTYVLYFEQTNVVYFYQGGQIKAGNIIRICPLSSDEYASGLWLFLGKNPYGDFKQWVDMTEATSLKVEDFYTRFVDGDEKSCIDLKASAFR